jgi:hypothetical protein
MTNKCNSVCENCTCNRRYFSVSSFSVFAANSSYAPSKKPIKAVRRDPFKAILDLQERYNESMNILS